MNIVFVFIAVVLAIICLFGFSLTLVFYHCFSSNKQAMDKYALASVIVFGVLFYVLMKGVILRW